MAMVNVRNRSASAGLPALRIANGVGFVLDTAAIIIAVASVVAIFLALMTEVAIRYLTHASLGWPNEVPNLLFPWLIMGGIVLGAHRGSHIAAEAFRCLLSTEQLRILLMLIHLLVAIAFAYLGYLSLQVISITRAQVFPMTGLGQAWAYSSLMFGFGGIAVASLVNLVRVAFCDDPRTMSKQETEHMT
ncbi:TRAP transporter small permease [Mesorhizobium plurifarium]|uniref:TRAP transporter small permease n=1 Tax=Sinorhizobium arboris TaxID=76745 RepID=UPI000484808F|nr:TRAP transporter small permease [Sinorhizobium arboris]PST24240.1 TRAP transporter small permease [Mesorhizobium plurifarium]